MDTNTKVLPAKTVTGTDKTAKPEASKQVAAPKIVPFTPSNELPPLDERLHRLNQLFELQGKHAKLKESQQRLREFKLSSGDDSGCYITIRDDDRHEFTTYNTAAVIEVIEHLQKTIEEKIKAIEPLLRW